MIPRLQLQLAAHVVHLGDLCLLQRRGEVRIVGAGVGHGVAQPQRIEVIAQIVVLVNVVARAGQGVGTWPMQPTGHFVCNGMGIADAAQAPIDGGDESDEIALDFDPTRAVSIAEAYLRIAQQTPKGISVRNTNSFGGRDCARTDVLTGPSQFELDGRIAEPGQEAAQQPALQRLLIMTIGAGPLVGSIDPSSIRHGPSLYLL
jgi:hypothetical protein